MVWMRRIGVALVALVLAVVIAGWMLPREHVATATAHIAAPPEVVWQTITTPTLFPTWRHDIERVDSLPPSYGGPSWREHSSNGDITYVVDVFDKPERLVTRIADTTLAFGGTWEYCVEPDAGGSRVTITEHGWVSNPIYRIVSRFIIGQSATMNAYLRSLGERFGKEPKVETVT